MAAVLAVFAGGAGAVFTGGAVAAVGWGFLRGGGGVACAAGEDGGDHGHGDQEG